MTTLNTFVFLPLAALMAGTGIGACAMDATQHSDPAIELSDIDLTASIPHNAPFGRAWIMTPDGEMEVSFDIVDGRAIAEGDIDLGLADALLSKGDGILQANASFFYNRWPDGRIRYVRPGFNQTAINAAIATLEEQTDIDFVPVTIPTGDVLMFVESNDVNVSSSAVGRQGGLQIVRIWPTHGSSTVMHELLHAAGLWHEQSRSDRNDFINVNLGCAPMSRWHNFERKVPLTGIPIGAFDFDSIMLYDSFEFSTMIPECPTMTRKDGSTFSSNNTPSTGDIAAVNAMF